MAEGTSGSLRLLTLTLNLVNTDVGITKATLRQLVPGYDAADVAFERRFERDLVTLRDTGLIVDVVGEKSSPRYRINGSSFPAPDVNFTSSQVELLAGAACAWDHLGAAGFSRLMTKLGAYSSDTAVLQPSGPTYGLEGSEYLTQVLTAIEQRQPVRFLYSSQRGEEERDVAPWSLLVRGRAVYLWGFDLNRWEPRLFRLSRVRSDLALVGEPGAYEIPQDPGQDIAAQVFVVRPLLWIKQGAGDLLRMHTDGPVDPADYPHGYQPREGWDLCWGKEDDQAVWERLIFDDCLNVVPDQPATFRERMYMQLQIAAAWKGAADGDA